MKIKHGSKVAIIGAGAVGSSIAFAMAIQQLCTELVPRPDGHLRR